MSLTDELRMLSKRVKAQRDLMTNEAATCSASVDPFIRALGYDTQDLGQVFREYDADPKWTGGKTVDYAILRRGQPAILVEAKSAKTSLSGPQWEQLYAYFNATEASFGILTNGLVYEIYGDLKTPNVMDRQPFLVIDMVDLDLRLAVQLEPFTRASFDSEKILANARQTAISRVLEQEMANPSDTLVRYFARQIQQNSVPERDLPVYASLVRRAWQELAAPTPISPPSLPPPPSPSPASEFIPVFGHYGKHRFKAELLRKSVADGLTIAGNQIRYSGEITWLKNAAVLAIRSVDGSFEPTKTYPNGFQFWHVIDPLDGKERKISCISGWDISDADEALRQRVLSS